MSDSSTARKLQHRFNVKYNAALLWVRDKQYRDEAGSSRREGQSFSDRLIEVIITKKDLKESTP